MAMRESELGHVVADLQSLVGRPLRGVWQPERQQVVVGIAESLLLLVPRGPDARLHTVATRSRSPDRPFSFQGACRAHLHGPLTALTQVPGDRVVDLWFGSRRLHLRLTGRGGGLWLLDGDTVVAAYDGPAAALPDLPAPGAPSEPPRFVPGPDEDWDAAARRFLGAQERDRELVALRARVHRALLTDIDRRQRLREALERDLDKASEAPRWRRQGDALAAALHRVPRGATGIRLPDLEDPEILHDVVLDPQRPASATLDRLYAKARRLDRAADHVLRHLEQVEAEQAAATRQLAEVADASADRLREMSATTPALGAPSTPLAWHVWTGPAGERVFVGRDAKSNRKLTFQHARGRDFWLHVRDRPAAHVVVPVEGDHTPPLELLLAAAQIALVHAKIAEGVAADVQYTRVKHVRAVPGEVGRVTLHEEKVLHVQRSAAALAGWRRS